MRVPFLKLNSAPFPLNSLLFVIYWFLSIYHFFISSIISVKLSSPAYCKLSKDYGFKKTLFSHNVSDITLIFDYISM